MSAARHSHIFVAAVKAWYGWYQGLNEGRQSLGVLVLENTHE